MRFNNSHLPGRGSNGDLSDFQQVGTLNQICAGNSYTSYKNEDDDLFLNADDCAEWCNEDIECEKQEECCYSFALNKTICYLFRQLAHNTFNQKGFRCFNLDDFWIKKLNISTNSPSISPTFSPSFIPTWSPSPPPSIAPTLHPSIYIPCHHTEFGFHDWFCQRNCTKYIQEYPNICAWDITKSPSEYPSVIPSLSPTSIVQNEPHFIVGMEIRTFIGCMVAAFFGMCGLCFLLKRIWDYRKKQKQLRAQIIHRREIALIELNNESRDLRIEDI